LRRVLGKIDNTSPGEVVEKLQRKSHEILATTQTLYINSRNWYQRLANPPAQWLQLQTSVENVTPEYAGDSEMQLWAVLTNKPIVSLNAVTGKAMVYEPVINKLPTMRTDLHQTHNNLIEKYGKAPG
jgi:hypothetical protein